MFRLTYKTFWEIRVGLTKKLVGNLKLTKGLLSA